MVVSFMITVPFSSAPSPSQQFLARGLPLLRRDDRR
jgi:hypothetical protein